MNAITNWLIRRAQRTPYVHLPGYMNRWWLVPYSDPSLGEGTGLVSWWRRPIARTLQAFDIAVRVHEILRSGSARDPHDHPWWYLTIILKGGYMEARYNDDGYITDADWWEPGSILFRRAGSWHRLDLPEHTTAWTLFITGPYRQGWGFNVKGRKVPHREYRE